jgi:hypothetical protein
MLLPAPARSYISLLTVSFLVFSFLTSYIIFLQGGSDVDCAQQSIRIEKGVVYRPSHFRRQPSASQLTPDEAGSIDARHGKTNSGRAKDVGDTGTRPFMRVDLKDAAKMVRQSVGDSWSRFVAQPSAGIPRWGGRTARPFVIPHP